MREPDGLGAPLGELVGTTGKERLRGTCSGDRHRGEMCAAAQRPLWGPVGMVVWLWCTSYGASQLAHVHSQQTRCRGRADTRVFLELADLSCL